MVFDNDNWLLPVLCYCTQPGEEWVDSDDISVVKISTGGGHSWRDVEVSRSLDCVHMNITMLHNGTLVALSRSCWADNIYISHSADNDGSQSVPQATELPNNNSSIQITTLTNDELVLVYNAISAVDTVEHRALSCDEIDDDGDSRKESTAVGCSAFQGASHVPMTVAISTDGGKSWP